MALDLLRAYKPVTCFLTVATLAVFISIGFVQAATDNRIAAVQSLLKGGEIDESILTAREALKDQNLSEITRLKLLRLIARGAYSRTKSGQFKEIDPAIDALKTLLKEFPTKVNGPDIRWKILWLYWKHGDIDNTEAAINNLVQHHPQTVQAGRALLIQVKIRISIGQYSKARQALLQFGLNDRMGPQTEARGFAWLAVINKAEGHFRSASKQMNRAFSRISDTITSNSLLYSTYIQLLALDGKDGKALHHIENYLTHFVTTPETPSIQLLYGDILARQRQWDKAATIYDILSEQEAETSIGKKAFIRKLMMQNNNITDAGKLRAPLLALERIANQNQLTGIEAEAHLYQAELIARGAKARPGKADKAIAYYSMVLLSGNSALKAKAIKQGSEIFTSRLASILQKEQWLQTIILWKRFPQFRPRKQRIDNISYKIAHAYRMLTDYAHAEEILDRIEKKSMDSIWGQKVMLEKAHVWMDRKDVEGVNKVMSWLGLHENTLYRPEMLLIASQMQLAMNHASAASQTIKNVNADDLTIESRADFWQARAQIAEKLGHWHAAATAWGNLAMISKKKAARWLAIWYQANALFKSDAYAKAMKLYLKIPEPMRPMAWSYQLAVCEMRTGRQTQGIKRLKRLISKPGMGLYTQMARLTLAKKKAKSLLRSR